MLRPLAPRDEFTTRCLEQRELGAQLGRARLLFGVERGGERRAVYVGELRDGFRLGRDGKTVVADDAPRGGLVQRAALRGDESGASPDADRETARAQHLLRERAARAVARSDQRPEPRRAAPERERDPDQENTDD